jgi:hypothetical protein
MAQQILSTNTFTTAKWIVSNNATTGAYDGTHTTIASALTSASSGDTIFIRPGTYTENPTLKAGVNLTAFGSDASSNQTGNVTIVGKCTFTGAGTVTISGIELQTNSDYLLAITGSAASVVNLVNCNLNMGSTGIDFASSSASAAINVFYCTGNLSTTGIGIFAHSSAGALAIRNSFIGNSGASTTPSTASAGFLYLSYSVIQNPITTSSTNSLGSCVFTTIDCGVINTTALTIGGSGTNNISSCSFGSGTAEVITISATLTISNSSINSTNSTAVITGAGTINYVNLAFVQKATISTSTQSVAGVAMGSTTTAPTAGMIGEQLRGTRASGSASSLTSLTALSYASVSLTPGIWDISVIGSFISGGTTNATEYIVSISSTNNTLSGASGDQQVVLDTLSGIINFAPTLVVPSFRVTLTSTTIYYAVAQSTFTISTMSVYGRISATRVG